jgi:hypothetical protein
MSHEPRLVEVRKNILEQNAKTGRGMDNFLQLLEGGLQAVRSGAAAGVAL